MLSTAEDATFEEWAAILVSQCLLHQEIVTFFFDQFEVFNILKQLLSLMFLLVPFNYVVSRSFILQPP